MSSKRATLHIVNAEIVFHLSRANMTISQASSIELINLTSVINRADKSLPRHKPGIQKHWWTSDFTAWRDKSIEIHRLWQLEGKPRSGPTNDECQVQKKPNQACWNKLHSSFLSKNTTDFWKQWKQFYSKNSPDLHPVVNGVSTKSDIADSFKCLSRISSKSRNQMISNK